MEMLPDSGPDGWLFPSERGTTPVARDNCWRRHFLQRLKEVGLGWVLFPGRTREVDVRDLVEHYFRTNGREMVVDISRNAISRKAVEASAEQLKQLQDRRWENVEILVIYIDGQRGRSQASTLWHRPQGGMDRIARSVLAAHLRGRGAVVGFLEWDIAKGKGRSRHPHAMRYQRGDTAP